MRYLKKAIICILAFVILINSGFTVMSETIYTIDGYSYTIIDNDLASIVGWDNRADTLVIPNKIGNLYVSNIADNAFLNDDYIKQIDLFQATRLYSIGMFSFSNSALEGYLSIPTGITSIGIGAFEGCNGLTELTFSSNGGIVPSQCFRNCKNLETITLSSFITTIQYYAFSGCDQLKKITIPNSVVNISKSAFLGDNDLVIYCYADSYAHQYAVENGIDYVLIDAPAPTGPPTEEPTVAPTEEPTTAPTETPTPEPTEAPAETIAPILGDAGGNGEIDLTDATMIQRYLAELPVEVPLEILMNGDVDGDGELTISDVTFIQRYEAEMESIYPIGRPIN